MSEPSCAVTRADALAAGAIDALFAQSMIEVRWLSQDADIPGSYWGAPEAGIAQGRLWLRPDTPVHSALHEGGHLLCMGAERRVSATRDAGGDDAEECAVCYLSVLMADALAGYTRERLFTDMDAWGYSFRLGGSARWFAEDAADARRWLLGAGLARATNTHGWEQITWNTASAVLDLPLVLGANGSRASAGSWL